MITLYRYWSPGEVTCPTCQAKPGQQCKRRRDAAPRYHVARRQRPVIYLCNTCERPCAIGVTGNLVHIGKVDTTHSADVGTEPRRMLPRED